MTTRVSTPSRIHATLLDMNGALGRIDGGVGITLADPGWVLSFQRNDHGIQVSGDANGVDTGSIHQIALEAMHAVGKDPALTGLKITVYQSIPRHIGLGSHTQLSLAILDGVCKEFNAPVPRSKESFASIVNRGGTSGIGIASYFEGGVIVDGGHAFGRGKEKDSFSPSSASRARPGPVLLRDDLPASWRVVCAIPALEAGASGQVEIDVFKSHCPVPLQQVQYLSHVVLMKLMPAIKTYDFDALCECINIFQDTGFKKVEVDLRGVEFRQIMQSWRDAGAPCVGMSSFGPTLYSLAPSAEKADDIKRQIDSILGGKRKQSFVSEMSNKGACVD